MKTIDNKNQVFQYISDEYGISPEYPWKDSPDACVFRHTENSKWFALVMEVRYSQLGIEKEGNVFILNVKCDPLLISSITADEGYYPAYHMNKKHWLTILLDGTLTENQVVPLIDMSFELTATKNINNRRSLK